MTSVHDSLIGVFTANNVYGRNSGLTARSASVAIIIVEVYCQLDVLVFRALLSKDGSSSSKIFNRGTTIVYVGRPVVCKLISKRIVLLIYRPGGFYALISKKPGAQSITISFCSAEY